MPADIDDLARRLSALEKRLGAAPAGVDPGTFWVIEGLRRELAQADEEGLVVFAGSWTREGERGTVEWQYGQPVAELIEEESEHAASTLAALGHPVRLDPLRGVLAGTASTRELGGVEGLGTSGQLHHHLRILVAAGWLRARRRGEYEVPAQRVIPLLVILSAAAG